jgi:hypothetical protein
MNATPPHWGLVFGQAFLDTALAAGLAKTLDRCAGLPIRCRQCAAHDPTGKHLDLVVGRGRKRRRLDCQTAVTASQLLESRLPTIGGGARQGFELIRSAHVKLRFRNRVRHQRRGTDSATAGDSRTGEP